MILAATVFSILLMLPSFEIGFSLDDYIQIGLIEEWYDVDAPALDLYSSFLDLPTTPWWVAPEAQVAAGGARLRGDGDDDALRP